MRMFKLIGALPVVLAFSATAVASTAFAAEVLWKWLPGSAGETFSGEQLAKGTLETLGGKKKTTCEKLKVLLTDETLKASSELLKEGATEGKDATLELMMIHWEGCKAEGLFAANSLGDASGVILEHLEVHNCMIKKGEFGLLMLPLALHVEVPAVGLLFTVLEKGLFIVKLEPEAGSKTKFILTAKQKAGDQEIQKCEGGESETLLVKTDNEAEEDAALETTIKLTFDLTKDKEGQTMMET